MSIDTRTDAERRYDAERAGSLYVSQDEDAIIDWILRETEDLDDDEPTLTMLDDGQASGVRVERWEQPVSHSTWLDFCVGPEKPRHLCVGVMLNLDYVVKGGPVELIVNGEQINGPWTLATLRQLHAELGRILTNPLLPGALSEAWSFYEQGAR